MTEPAPTLAYWSPLPQASSGIADYSAELLPHLSNHFSIEVFTENGARVEEALAERCAIFPARAFTERHRARPFDAVLYQMGNNGDFHADAYRTLLTVPGIVVLHEVVLHHMIRELTLATGDPDAYLEEVRYCCGASGAALARRSLATGTPFDVWSYPLFERVVDRSLGVLVHNEACALRVRASRPTALVHTVPFPWSADVDAPGAKAADIDAVRASLGVPPGALLVASFGFMTRSKRLDVALRAFARLCRELPEARYLVVGEISKDYDLETLLAPDARAKVIVTGRVPLPRFLGLMAAADLAINLRYPTAGETSASLIRLMAAGKPVVVSRTGSFLEVPEGCVAAVDPDESEEELLLAYLRRLGRDEALRRALGDNARRHVLAHHRVEQTAEAYAAAIDAILAARSQPFTPAPPLAPYPPEDVLSETIAAVSEEVVTLGAVEGEDDDLLQTVAEAVVELGLSPRPAGAPGTSGGGKALT